MSCLFHTPQNQTANLTGGQTCPSVCFDENIVQKFEKRKKDFADFLAAVKNRGGHHYYGVLLEQPEKIADFFQLLLDNKEQPLLYLHEYGALCAAIDPSFSKKLKQELLKHNFSGDAKSFIIYNLKAALTPADFVTVMMTDLEKRKPTERDIKNYLFCLQDPGLLQACSDDDLEVILNLLDGKEQGYLLSGFVSSLEERDYPFKTQTLQKIGRYLSPAIYARLLIKQPATPEVTTLIKTDSCIKMVDRDIILMARGELPPLENLEKIMNALVRSDLNDLFFWQKVKESFANIQPQTAPAAFMQRLYQRFEGIAMNPAKLFLLADLIQPQFFHPTFTQKIKAKITRNHRLPYAEELLTTLLLAKAGEHETVRDYLKIQGLKLDQNLIYNNLHQIYDGLVNPLSQQELAQQTWDFVRSMNGTTDLQAGEIFEVLGKRLPDSTIIPLIKDTLKQPKFYFSASSISAKTWQEPRLNAAFRKVCLEFLEDYNHSLVTQTASRILTQCIQTTPLSPEERQRVWGVLTKENLATIGRGREEIRDLVQVVTWKGGKDDYRKIQQLLQDWRGEGDSEIHQTTEDFLVLALMNLKNKIRQAAAKD